ncbi:MAG: formyltransferase family protein [Myxococcota bacterium]
MTRSGATEKLSAIVACYRDAPAVPIMHERLTATFDQLGVDYEIIFVNDNSPDDAREVLAALAGGVQLVVLAGYLKLVPAPVVARYRWRMINIHPALLPAFGGPGMYGRRVHEAVLASGATESGTSVHYVDEEFDRGPVIAQARVPVLPNDTPETLADRVLEAEHELLPNVVLELARHGLPDHPVKLIT